ncbi:MAG: hypothetical protein RIB84_00625 [Sneathiellaceae bacterium]
MAQVQLIEATGYAQARSTSSLAIGTGTKVWTLARHIAFATGMTVVADAGSGNSMAGAVTAYDPSTLALTLDVDTVNGSGTHAAWVIGGVRTIRAATGRGYARTANFYEPRVAGRVNVERRLNRDGVTFGASEIGFGSIELINTGYNAGEEANPLDELRTLAWDGRPLKVLVGDDGAAYGTFETLIDGTAEKLISPARSAARWTWRDPMALLDVPILSERFGGTTTGASSGSDGGAEMAGIRKQLLLGTVAQVEPQLANASKQLYLVSLSQVAISSVTIAGATQTAGTAHGSLAALIAATVTSGTYDSYTGADGTWIRAGSAVTGPIRVTASEGATSADRTIAQLWKRLLTDWTALSPTVSAGDVTALDTAQDGEAGILIAGDLTIRQAADFLAGSAGADYWRTVAGTWRIAQLAAPTGTPDLELRLLRPGGRARAAEVAILDFAPVDRDLLPPSQVSLRHSRYAPQSRTELAGIALEAAADLGAEWRQADYPAEPDETVLARHLLAEPRSFDSAFAAAAPAAEEAERRHTLLAGGLFPLDVTVPLSEVAGVLELAAVVRVTMDRHQLDDGPLFSLRGYRTDRSSDTVVLELLGFGL